MTQRNVLRDELASCPLTVHRMLRANGETVEWSLRLDGLILAVIFVGPDVDRREAARMLLRKAAS